MQIKVENTRLAVIGAAYCRTVLNQLQLLVKVKRTKCAYSLFLFRAFSLSLTSFYFKCFVRQEEHWDSIKTHFLLCTKIKSSDSKTDTSSWKSIETLDVGLPFSQMGTKNRTLKSSPILKLAYWFLCKVEELRIL